MFVPFGSRRILQKNRTESFCPFPRTHRIIITVVVNHAVLNRVASFEIIHINHSETQVGVVLIGVVKWWLHRLLNLSSFRTSFNCNDGSFSLVNFETLTCSLENGWIPYWHLMCFRKCHISSWRKRILSWEHFPSAFRDLMRIASVLFKIWFHTLQRRKDL